MFVKTSLLNVCKSPGAIKTSYSDDRDFRSGLSTNLEQKCALWQKKCYQDMG